MKTKSTNPFAMKAAKDAPHKKGDKHAKCDAPAKGGKPFVPFKKGGKK